MFQFHKGTIKTLIDYLRRLVEDEFQFHKGTIKTSYVELHRKGQNVSIP